MKGKNPVRELADVHDSSLEEDVCAYDKKDVLEARENEALPDFELEMDVDDEAQVQSIDGVIIEGDDEVARLLFYYYKPKGVDAEGELVKCRCIAEFRVSRSKLKEIVKDINDNIRHVRKNLGRRNQNVYQDKLPMYS